MKAYCINLKDREDRWNDFKLQSFPFEVERFEAIKDSPGWVGCAKSFLKLYESLTEFPCAIFEDDCMMLRDWDEVDRIIKQLPEDWDMLNLGATLNEPLVRYSENLFVLKNAYCLHGVIYNSRKVLDFILDNKDEIRKIDVFITQKVHTTFKCFVTYPMIATQRPGHSDIVNKFTTYKELNDSYKKFTQ